MVKRTEDRVRNLDQKLDQIMNRLDTIEAALAAKNVEPQINEKGTRGHPLTDEQLEAVRGQLQETLRTLRGL